MVDIQPGTAEKKRGKKEERRNHSNNMECPHVLCRAAIKQKGRRNHSCKI